MLSFIILSACGGGNDKLPVVTSYAKWDKTFSVSDSVIPAFYDAEDSVLIGDGASMLVYQDKLFIDDPKSSDKMIHVVNIPQVSYVGSFGKFGDGPGEILQPGNLFTLPGNRLALIDYGHWCVKSFDVDSALTDADYVPQTIVRFSEQECTSGFPDRFVSVRDGWGVARLINIKGAGDYSQSLCTFDVWTGRIEPFGEQDDPDGFHSSVAASEADNLVVEVSSNQDVIRMYDLEGNLLREIHGPLYESRPSRDIAFYSKAVIGDGKVFAVYSGEPKYQNFHGRQIVVFTTDGEYLYTYQLNDRIRDIAYSGDYKRLYLSTDGRRQFGYLQLGGDSSVGGIGHGPAMTAVVADSETADEQPVATSAQKEEKLPTIMLIDPNEKLRRVPVSEALLMPYRASDTDPVCYYALIVNQAQTPDTVCIDSVSADIPSKFKFHKNYPLFPGLLTSITIIPEGELTKTDVTMTIHYNGNRRQDLHVKLHKPQQ